MKAVKIISQSNDGGSMQVITDEGTTKHIKRNGSSWMYLDSMKVLDNGEERPVFKEIKMDAKN